MSQTTGIHCKVICDDQVRRFQFSGTEFSSLQNQVKQLLGLNREFVLKYKDNEDDMITISSTEELACAIDINTSQKDDRGLIRLTVFFPEPSPSDLVPFPFEHGRGFCHRGYGPGHEFSHHGFGRDFCHRGHGRDFSHHGHGRDFCHRGHGRDFWPHGHGLENCHRGFGGFEREQGFGFWPQNEHGQDFHSLEHGKGFCHRGFGGRRWGGRCHKGGPFSSDEQWGKNRFEKRREKMTFKRDLLKAYLSSLEQEKELSPIEERRKVMLQAKVQRLDSFLSEFPLNDKVDTVEKPEFCQPKEEFYRKCERKERKCERKMHKEGKKKEAKDSYLSDEAKAEIHTLKSQIKEMKPALWAIQEQLKVKKSAVKVAYETGQQSKIPELKNEIGKLKIEKRAKKAEIKPLHQRVHQLKSGK